MTIFGNTAIDLILHQGADDIATAIDNDASVALFVFLETFPMSTLLIWAAMLMVVIFFVTSSDSGAMVVDVLASNGNNNTQLWQRFYWTALIGTVASVLLLAGGLSALQTIAIAGALPFCIILVFASYGLLKALKRDLYKKDSQQSTSLTPSDSQNSLKWDKRLKNLMKLPSQTDAEQFISQVVGSALDDVSIELRELGLTVAIDKSEIDRVRLKAYLADETNFVYEVRAVAYSSPTFIADLEDSSLENYYRADVFLREGGQDYDIMGWTHDQVINDIIDQYEKHLHFLHLVRDDLV